ncbi:proteasome maturation protein [[Emmonsia] crescens]|uniref:Proteasome maturation protein n=1 Tax=[Emmonsia] crescens TaxID=73230 RepID=A0A2B7ZR77_9EURO|nr:proteasome maturation protein [Emmonsia crescens]
MSLRIAPPASNATQTSNTASVPHLNKGAPSAPGVHDILRASLSPAPTTQQQRTTASTHPLEARLLQWRQTHDAMKMESLRRVYGIAEPIRRGMELKIVQEGQWKPAALGGRNESTIHEDILTLGGRETEVTWEDVFDGDDLREPATFHDEMEHRLKMNW